MTEWSGWYAGDVIRGGSGDDQRGDDSANGRDTEDIGVI